MCCNDSSKGEYGEFCFAPPKNNFGRPPQNLDVQKHCSGNHITRVSKTRVRPRQAKARPGVRPDFRPDVRPDVRRRASGRASGRTSGRTPNRPDVRPDVRPVAPRVDDVCESAVRDTWLTASGGRGADGEPLAAAPSAAAPLDGGGALGASLGRPTGGP